MRFVALTFALTIAAPALAGAQPFDRPDGFFERNFLSAEREDMGEIEPTQAEEIATPRALARDESDSWEAPTQDQHQARRPSLRGQDVAGSNRVRDFTRGEGEFAPRQEQNVNPQAGFQAIPLGNGFGIVVPGADVFAGDSFEVPPRAP